MVATSYYVKYIKSNGIILNYDRSHIKSCMNGLFLSSGSFQELSTFQALINCDCVIIEEPHSQMSSSKAYHFS